MKSFAKVSCIIIALLGASLAQAGNPADHGLEPVKESRSQVAHLKLDHDFSRYDSVVIVDMIVDEVEIKQPKRSAVQRSDWEMDEHRQADAQAMYREAFEREFAKADGLEIVEEPGENSLIIVMQLAEVSPAVGYDPRSVASRSRVYSEGAGSAKVAMYLVDAKSGELVGVAGSSRQLGQVWGVNNGVSNRGNAQFAFKVWAREAREAIENLPEIVAEARS